MIDGPHSDVVLARLTPSPGRRFFAVGSFGILGALLIYLALALPGGSVPIILLLLLAGGLATWMAWLLWQATASSIELTAEGLRDSNGRILAALPNIERVDRGVFVFKPSGGFSVVLKTKGFNGWAPGLWWISGRRVGIGGVTRSAEARYMAEILVMELAKYDPT